jgi:hypothetical protein
MSLCGWQRCVAASPWCLLGAGSVASDVLGGFQAQMGQATDAMSGLATAPTAENFLAAQTSMMNVQGEFELGVKFAGQIEQDINKLTSLQ